MPTIQERLDVFYQSIPGFQFSNRKIRTIKERVYCFYSTEQTTLEDMWWDRQYPVGFSPIIDKAIRDVYNEHHLNVTIQDQIRGTGTSKSRKKSNAKPAQVVEPEKKQRKRIPARKPEYSTKNFKK